MEELLKLSKKILEIEKELTNSANINKKDFITLLITYRDTLLEYEDFRKKDPLK